MEFFWHDTYQDVGVRINMPDKIEARYTHATHAFRRTHGMAGSGKASVAGAEGTVSSGRSDRRNGSGDLGGKTKVLDGGKGCKEEIEEWKIYKNQCS